ncbi:MAG: DUF7524 family protein [Halococcoides sp.]
MSDTLPVHVSRERLHGLGVPDAIEVSGPFEIDLHNHGEGVHLHVHLEGALADVASLPAANHYLDAGDRRVLTVELPEPTHSIRGKLKVVSAHGATTRYVDVVVRPPAATTDTVRVDESLATPPSRPAPSPAVDAVDDPRTLAALAGALALVVGVVVAVLADSLLVTVAVLVVLVAVLVAIAWTAR